MPIPSYGLGTWERSAARRHPQCDCGGPTQVSACLGAFLSISSSLALSHQEPTGIVAISLQLRQLSSFFKTFYPATRRCFVTS